MARPRRSKLSPRERLLRDMSEAALELAEQLERAVGHEGRPIDTAIMFGLDLDERLRAGDPTVPSDLVSDFAETCRGWLAQYAGEIAPLPALTLERLEATRAAKAALGTLRGAHGTGGSLRRIAATAVPTVSSDDPDAEWLDDEG